MNNSPRFSNRRPPSRRPGAKPFGRNSAQPSGRPAFARRPAPAKVPGPSPIPAKNPDEFPMRINKYLAMKGYSTRRDADKLIAKKLVTLNGRFAVLGDKVTADDTVEVRNTKKAADYVYYAYNKPRGVATEDNRKGTKSIMSSIPLRGVFPVAGLDPNAEGLILLTNDRRVIDRLLNPAHAHAKEYLIHTVGPLRSNFQEKMNAAGMSIHILSPKMFTIRVTDTGSGIRDACATYFAEIESMKRTRILNIFLDKLPANAYRRIVDDELQSFLHSLGLVEL